MRTAEAEDKAYSEILRAIMARKYSPGDHLAEARIADELEMSRTPVRNALKKMTACGILEYVKNVGCRIPVLSPNDMEDVFRTRALLESHAAELAAVRLLSAEDERLTDLLPMEKAYYSRGDVAGYAKINAELHLGIASASRNSYVERCLSQLFWRSEIYVFFFDSFYFYHYSQISAAPCDPSDSKSCREHEALIRMMVTDKNPSEAGRLMYEHIMSTYEAMTGDFRFNLMSH